MKIGGYMTKETHISSSIDTAGDKAQYDEHIKNLIKDKNVLAYILVYTVEEFADYTIEQARDAIDGEPEIIKRKIRPDVVHTLENESKIPGEGVMYFDIVFYARYGNERKKLYVNIEAQKSFYPGYDLVTRGIIYPARLISQQMDVEYTASDYDGVKKVYSIWICMNAPGKNRDDERVSDSIIKYSIKPDVVYPKDKRIEEIATGRYDIMSTVFVNLNADKTINSKNKLISMLSTLLSVDIKTQEKKKRLEEEYGIKMSKELESEMSAMCNLSDIVEERGIEKGIEQGKLATTFEFVQSKALSPQIAAESLGVTVEQLKANMEKAGFTFPD